MRIGGFDGNTFYQVGNIGITCNSGNTISFNMWGGNTPIMTLQNTSVNITQPLTLGNDLTIGGRTYFNGGLTVSSGSWIYDTNSKQRIYFGVNNRTYFQGYGPTPSDNAFEFWNSSSTVILGINDNGNAYFLNQITCKFYTIANSGTDYIGVAANTGSGSNGNYTMYVMYGSFTGFHRCFINDDLFDKNDIQTFKDTYLGRIVISTGKIATDTKDTNDPETDWNILYDKEGITIEDSHPIVQLSRKKKDKKVFGVLGMANRNSRKNDS